MQKFIVPPTVKQNKVICFSYDKIHYESTNTSTEKAVWLKLEETNHELSGFYSTDGVKWIVIGEKINVTALDRFTRNYNGWCGNRQGLYVQGRNYADFDLYIYVMRIQLCWLNVLQINWNSKNAFTDGVTLLDDIHSNDWALYAGVEFGSKDYPKISKKLLFGF